MAEKYLKGLYKQPTLHAKEWSIRNHYQEFSALVNGYIEVIPFPGMEDVVIILNEEGKIYDLTPNVICDEYDDVFVGPVIVVGEKGDDFRSLTAKEMEKALHYLEENDYFLQFEKETEAQSVEEQAEQEEREMEL